MYKVLGHKVELLHSYCGNAADVDRFGELICDVLLQLVQLYSNIISFLRGTVDFERKTEEAWLPLTLQYDEAIRSIDETLQHVEKLSRQAAHVDELQSLQMLLKLSTIAPNDNAKLPCIILPPAKMAHFYDRAGIIEKIEAHFSDDQMPPGIRSLALFGLGGVGKSHVALKYAHTKIQEFSAILWVQSESVAALGQSFNEIAIRLNLSAAGPQSNEENRVKVLDWLQKTSCKWLLIYDNAENSDHPLDYWPIGHQGQVVITTRNHTLAYEPAETGIEVLPFDQEAGTRFVLHLLSMDIGADVSDSEIKSASELSEKLSGHALAISQMAGLIYRRSWTIEEFLAIYDRNSRKMLGLDAVWRLSFESLDDNTTALLAVLSYVNPDNIPQALFEPNEIQSLPESLKYCADEVKFFEALDILLTLALVKREKTTRVLSLHRLVQTKLKHLLSVDARQRAFDDATQLLYYNFPHATVRSGGQLFNQWKECQRYYLHALALKNNFKEAATTSESLKPTVMFCKLLSALARFLIESAQYPELRDVLQVSQSAFDGLRIENRNPELQAAISVATGVMWAQQGLYARSIPAQLQAHKLRSQMVPPDLVSLSWAEVDLGNVTASMGRYEESLKWQLKAMRNRQIHDKGDDLSIKQHGVLCQNLGRAYLWLHRFPEAHIWCTLGIEILHAAKSWAMVAYTYFVLGNIHRFQGNFKLAQDAFNNGRNIWLDHELTRLHHFNGVCAYKLGCVAFELGDRTSAIEYLRESLAIAQLFQNTLKGIYARVLHKLSIVLAGSDEGKAEAGLKRRMAEELLIAQRQENGLPTINLIGNDHETLYDELVYILWR